MKYIIACIATLLVSFSLISKESPQATLNKEKGAKFLAENKKKPGIVERNSGLQYKVIREGRGEKPSSRSTVKVHYKGTLLDGTVFDSSYERGKPAEFGVTQVIPGWTEALKQMNVGAKWKVFIPYELAYGERGAGGVIGPCETLVFEIELLEIVE